MRYGGSKVLHLGKQDGLINMHCRTAAHVAHAKIRSCHQHLFAMES